MSVASLHLLAVPEDGSTSEFHTLTRRSDGAHFGHTWVIPAGFGVEHGAGKWTFNRGSLCIAAEWWPEVYEHESLAALMRYMEDNCPVLGSKV